MDAVSRCGTPEIINTDQGCQYTCKLWDDTLSSLGIQGSMDGRGRCKDKAASKRVKSNLFRLSSGSRLNKVNIWIERFWRSLKRECVYLNPVDTASQMRSEIARYIDYYNMERPHQGINNKMPIELCPEEIINELKNNKQRVA